MLIKIMSLITAFYYYFVQDSLVPCRWREDSTRIVLLCLNQKWIQRSVLIKRRCWQHRNWEKKQCIRKTLLGKVGWYPEMEKARAIFARNWGAGGKLGMNWKNMVFWNLFVHSTKTLWLLNKIAVQMQSYDCKLPIWWIEALAVGISVCKLANIQLLIKKLSREKTNLRIKGWRRSLLEGLIFSPSYIEL